MARDTETEPTPRSWMIIAAGAVVPLGLAIAAAVTTYITTSDRVAVTAWIAVAIVGTASVISTAVASRRRVSTVDRGKLGLRSVDHAHGVSKTNPD
jgi:small-conductance mechanosensitive channel